MESHEMSVSDKMNALSGAINCKQIFERKFQTVSDANHKAKFRKGMVRVMGRREESTCTCKKIPASKTREV